MALMRAGLFLKIPWLLILYIFNPVLFLLCRNTKRVESLDNCCAQMVAKEIKVLYSKGNQRPIYVCWAEEEAEEREPCSFALSVFNGRWMDGWMGARHRQMNFHLINPPIKYFYQYRFICLYSFMSTSHLPWSLLYGHTGEYMWDSRLWHSSCGHIRDSGALPVRATAALSASIKGWCDYNNF